MRHAIQLLFCFLAATSPIYAQEAADVSLPQADELRLEGVIASVDWPERRLSFAATHFVLPNGKGGAVKSLKPKTILLPRTTQFFVRGDWKTLLAAPRLKPGLFAVITGRDAGSGQPLTARIVGMWDKQNGATYSLGESDETDEPADLPAPTVPATAPPTVAPAVPPANTPAVTAPVNLTNIKALHPVLNSDFEMLDANNRPKDWKYDNRKSVQLVESDEGYYVSLNTRDGERTISRTVGIAPTWKTLKVSARVRGQGLKSGKNIWENAHIGLIFHNAKTEILGYAFPINLNGDSEWVGLSGIVAIPAGATSAVLDAGNFGVSGTFDIDDVRVQHDIAPDALPLIAGFPEGRFETLDEAGQPRGWNLFTSLGLSLETEKGNHFLRVFNAPTNAYVGLDSPWQIKPGTKTIRISARMRVRDLIKGKQGWETARVGLAFNKLNGEVAGGWPPSLELHADTDWKTLSETLPVPPDAVFFKITPQFINSSGTLDVDDVQIEQLP